MTSVTRRRLEEAADQARRDLAELDEQQSTGEIDEETGEVTVIGVWRPGDRQHVAAIDAVLAEKETELMEF